MAFPKTHIFSQLRREYAGGQLLESDADADAIAQFGKWFDQAVNDNAPHANAFTLATVDDSGQPSGRVLLLKDFDQRGFVFVTNYASRKGKELLANPKAGMVFFWEPLERQVRIEGVVEKTSAEDSADELSRAAAEAQIAAYTSHQSEVIASRQRWKSGTVPKRSSLALSRSRRRRSGEPIHWFPMQLNSGRAGPGGCMIGCCMRNRQAAGGK